MRELVVNADDWGAGTSVHEAVVRAHETGVVTSASVVVVGPEAEAAMRYAAARKTLGAGIHLALTEWPSAEPGAWTERGFRHERMPEDYHRLAFALVRLRDVASLVETEWRAQYRRFVEFGLGPPVHADSHQHIHLWPVLWPVFLKLATEFGVRFVRVPRLGASPWRVETGRFSRMPAAWALSAVSGARHPDVESHGLRTTDRVVGFMSGGGVDTNTAFRIVDSLPVGLTEWIAHPGATWTRPKEKGEKETRVLCDPELARKMSDGGVRLVNFAEATRV